MTQNIFMYERVVFELQYKVLDIVKWSYQK